MSIARRHHGWLWRASESALTEGAGLIECRWRFPRNLKTLAPASDRAVQTHIEEAQDHG
jgi:hypothetical protein